MPSDNPVLRVENLRAYHVYKGKLVHAVEDVSFEIEKGEAVGLFGESGAGKTSVALAVLGIFDKLTRYYASTSGDSDVKKLWERRDEAREKGLTSREIGMDLPGVEGKVWFKGQNLLEMDEEELRKIRGDKITYVPQGTSKSLNPIMTIAYQTSEPLRIHRGAKGSDKTTEMVLEVLDLVDIGDAEDRKDTFPTAFSTGEDQRVLIAAALITRPDLLIADEPTTAVDGAVQRKILDAINIGRREMGLSFLMISNDANIIADTCDKVGVMSSGRIMEFGHVIDVLKKPKHPFTRGYLMTNPSMAILRKIKEKGLRLRGIPGSPPSMIDPPPGCPFATRCDYVKDICREQVPEYREVEPGHWVLCHLAEELPEF